MRLAFSFSFFSNGRSTKLLVHRSRVAHFTELRNNWRSISLFHVIIPCYTDKGLNFNIKKINRRSVKCNLASRVATYFFFHMRVNCEGEIIQVHVLISRGRLSFNFHAINSNFFQQGDSWDILVQCTMSHIIIYKVDFLLNKMTSSWNIKLSPYG